MADLAMPALGFGTFPLKDEACAQAVAMALDVGYRHLDTAQIYRNEDAVGEGLRASGVPRDEVFVTTKVWWDSLRDGVLQRRAEESLERLGLEQLDLLLIHWPNPETPLAETMRALAEVRRRGLARHIGVSNFPSALLRAAAAACDEPIHAMQIEHHPFLAQRAIAAAAHALDIRLVAYSPLAQGLVNDDPTLGRIAAETGRTAAQVALRWLTQRGWAAVPKTTNEGRARANLASLDFELSPDQLAAIEALTARGVRTINHPFAPAWDAA